MDEALYREMRELERTYWWFVAKRRILRALIERHRPPTDDHERPRLIDLGCGTGALLDEMGERYETMGMDTHPAALAACAADGLSVREGRLPDGLPFEPGSADVVVLSDVLEHIGEDWASAVAAGGLLRPGGILVCTVPAHPWMWTDRDVRHHHHRRYTRERFVRTFDEAGLETVLMSWYNSALFPVMAAGRLARCVLAARHSGSEVRPLPGVLNAALREVFACEARRLVRGPLPFGASLVSVHRKPG